MGVVLLLVACGCLVAVRRRRSRTKARMHVATRGRSVRCGADTHHQAAGAAEPAAPPVKLPAVGESLSPVAELAEDEAGAHLSPRTLPSPRFFL